MEKIIEIKNLVKDYGHGRGVFDVSIDVTKGEVLGYLGPNGAGKSTTIRHLMGFAIPDSGKTYIKGKDTLKDRVEVMQDVSYIPGEVALPDLLTGRQVFEEQKALKNVKDDSFLKYLINLFKLDDSIVCKSMSLGSKRKIAIVSAFMSDPDVIILDEPSSGLDPEMQDIFIKLIEIEKGRGKTILLSSHIFREVDVSCDRIAIIKDGKIVSELNTEDLKHKNITEYTVYFKDKKDMTNSIDKLKKYKLVERQDLSSKYLVNADNIKDFILNISKLEIKDLSQKVESLEDYFMSFYKEDIEYGEM